MHHMLSLRQALHLVISNQPMRWPCVLALTMLHQRASGKQDAREIKVRAQGHLRGARQPQGVPRLEGVHQAARAHEVLAVSLRLSHVCSVPISLAEGS